MRRRSVLALGLTLVSLISACDSGPKGEGVLPANVVSNQPLGAVVLEFTGGAVTGFEGGGDTQVYWAAVAGTEPTFRVILVSPTGGPLSFGIRVSDLGAPHPAVAAITAASTSNAALVPSGLQIRIEG